MGKNDNWFKIETAVIEVIKPLAYMNPEYYIQAVPLHALEHSLVGVRKNSSDYKMISTKNVKLLKVFDSRDKEEIQSYIEKQLKLKKSLSETKIFKITADDLKYIVKKLVSEGNVPKPSQVRLVKKSIEHSKEVLKNGDFQPSGKGSKAYHEKNIINKEKYMEKWGHLANTWLKPPVKKPKITENKKLFIPRKLSDNDSRYTEHNNAQPIKDGIRINQYDIDGNKTGYWEEYHDNGNLWYKGSYKDGEMDGYWVWYHSNGKLDSKGNYVDGERDGIWTDYHDNGQLDSIGSYINGKLIKELPLTENKKLFIPRNIDSREEQLKNHLNSVTNSDNFKNELDEYILEWFPDRGDFNEWLDDNGWSYYDESDYDSISSDVCDTIDISHFIMIKTELMDFEEKMDLPGILLKRLINMGYLD
jgi:antitoxin component YwqK of YwqJK toxin-antitoxin module